MTISTWEGRSGRTEGKGEYYISTPSWSPSCGRAHQVMSSVSRDSSFTLTLDIAARGNPLCTNFEYRFTHPTIRPSCLGLLRQWPPIISISYCCLTLSETRWGCRSGATTFSREGSPPLGKVFHRCSLEKCGQHFEHVYEVLGNFFPTPCLLIVACGCTDDWLDR